MTEKQCGACKVVLPVTAFNRNRGKPDGLQWRCKTCAAIYFNHFKPQIMERLRARRVSIAGRRSCFAAKLKATFGLSVEDYAWLWLAQGGVCAICSQDLDDTRRRGVHVDHCHKTGRVRGLLCRECNLALGHFRDNPTFCRGAAAYLESR